MHWHSNGSDSDHSFTKVFVLHWWNRSEPFPIFCIYLMLANWVMCMNMKLPYVSNNFRTVISLCLFSFPFKEMIPILSSDCMCCIACQPQNVGISQIWTMQVVLFAVHPSPYSAKNLNTCITLSMCLSHSVNLSIF